MDNNMKDKFMRIMGHAGVDYTTAISIVDGSVYTNTQQVVYREPAWVDFYTEFLYEVNRLYPATNMVKARDLAVSVLAKRHGLTRREVGYTLHNKQGEQK